MNIAIAPVPGLVTMLDSTNSCRKILDARYDIGIDERFIKNKTSTFFFKASGVRVGDEYKKSDGEVVGHPGSIILSTVIPFFNRLLNLLLSLSYRVHQLRKRIKANPMSRLKSLLNYCTSLKNFFIVF